MHLVGVGVVDSDYNTIVPGSKNEGGSSGSESDSVKVDEAATLLISFDLVFLKKKLVSSLNVKQACN